ncbi:GNAT family N-acetyltransferase [Halobacillus yeomjeoni]|uniref:GNAT family N-acetyltransferase n=1 Tax=Halobacillus yeomjeoni TaxID=311194 RepID=UPI001CD53E8B|nr:GNAT family protein [Halobacillus yeomjeoni]MCA0985394.1 GNAT family N-acetyltransferase [Halobacillus yeomjeoni]
MDFFPLPQEDALRVAEWKYPDPFSFYDMTADEEDYEGFINPEKRSQHTHGVYEEGELIGFFTFHPNENGGVDIGLGLRPDLSGKGFGRTFVEEGLSYAHKHYNPTEFTLSVAAFNERAIVVYERAGFEKKDKFIQPTNGGIYEFVKMKKVVG